MANKNLERMKALIEEKHRKQESDNKLKPVRKMGSTHKQFMNQKTGGSNNKV